MTDAELMAKLETGSSVAVPYFGGSQVALGIDGVSDGPARPGIVTRAEAQEVLRAFLALTDEDRLEDSRHLLAYCRMMVEAVGEEEILEPMGGTMPTVETVWNFVRPKLIFFGDLDPGPYVEHRTIYLQLEGDVAWEPEHGLQMSWEGGDTLVKVGEFDGHPTNGHASGNPEHDRYVFRCFKPALCTMRERF